MSSNSDELTNSLALNSNAGAPLTSGVISDQTMFENLSSPDVSKVVVNNASSTSGMLPILPVTATMPVVPTVTGEPMTQAVVANMANQLAQLTNLVTSYIATQTMAASTIEAYKTKEVYPKEFNDETVITSLPYTMANRSYHEPNKYRPQGSTSLQQEFNKIPSSEIPKFDEKKGNSGSFHGIFLAWVKSYYGTNTILDGSEKEPVLFEGESVDHFRWRKVVWNERNLICCNLMVRVVSIAIKENMLPETWRSVVNDEAISASAAGIFNRMTKFALIDSCTELMSRSASFFALRQTSMISDEQHYGIMQDAYAKLQEADKDATLEQGILNSILCNSLDKPRHAEVIRELSKMTLLDFKKLTWAQLLKRVQANSKFELNNKQVQNSKSVNSAALVAFLSDVIEEYDEEGFRYYVHGPTQTIVTDIDNLDTAECNLARALFASSSASTSKKPASNKINGGNKRKSGDLGSLASDVTCYQCGLKGHYQSKCTTPVQKRIAGFPREVKNYGPTSAKKALATGMGSYSTGIVDDIDA